MTEQTAARFPIEFHLAPQGRTEMQAVYWGVLLMVVAVFALPWVFVEFSLLLPLKIVSALCGLLVAGTLLHAMRRILREPVIQVDAEGIEFVRAFGAHLRLRWDAVERADFIWGEGAPPHPPNCIRFSLRHRRWWQRKSHSFWMGWPMKPDYTLLRYEIEHATTLPVLIAATPAQRKSAPRNNRVQATPL